MSLVQAFCGGIASGKSTLSKSVAQQLGCKRVSFGDYVRKVARERGLDDLSVPVLQVIGQDMVRNHLEQFCRNILEEADWAHGQSLVLDGLRHVEVAEKLRGFVAPTRLVIICIDANRLLREKRLLERAQESPNADKTSLDRLDGHAMEEQSSTILRESADLVVEGGREITYLVQQIMDWIAILEKETP